MQGDIEMRQPDGLSLTRRKHADIGRQCELAGDLAFGVVIAMEQEDGDLGVRQPAHLLHEEESGLVVTPIAVIEVAGDDHEVDFVLGRLTDEVLERGARRGANSFGCRALLSGESLQRAVEMDVASVDKAKRFQGGASSIQRPAAKMTTPSVCCQYPQNRKSKCAYYSQLFVALTMERDGGKQRT